MPTEGLFAAGFALGYGLGVLTGVILGAVFVARLAEFVIVEPIVAVHRVYRRHRARP